MRTTKPRASLMTSHRLFLSFFFFASVSRKSEARYKYRETSYSKLYNHLANIARCLFDSFSESNQSDHSLRVDSFGSQMDLCWFFSPSMLSHNTRALLDFLPSFMMFAHSHRCRMNNNT